jgi:hypothetical protein
MDVFFQNAQNIFDVARSGASDESADFALMIRPDGGLHLVMDSPLSLEAAAVHGGARTVYRVQRFNGKVRVTGQMPGRTCVLEDAGCKPSRPAVLRDQPLYSVVSGNGGGSSRTITGIGSGSSVCTSGGWPAAAILAA